jgi:hypothetical protein
LSRARDDNGSKFHNAPFDPRQPKAVTVLEWPEQLVAIRLEESQAYKLSDKHVDKQRTSLVRIAARFDPRSAPKVDSFGKSSTN